MLLRCLLNIPSRATRHRPRGSGGKGTENRNMWSEQDEVRITRENNQKRKICTAAAKMKRLGRTCEERGVNEMESL
ncbi:hypothetical protein E2C01_004713 [Portunus trituberculatus]|uniref:Uncharacterized protein n=1 Tax=Portunus trituberculatus TaxID=210409 RepID=A0A5B7CUN2_PORTR|nr:hypothetical protein [Portunus trituberculatus]